MNSREKAVYITNMPYDMFKDLLGHERNAKKSLKECDRIMKSLQSQRPSDNRGNARTNLNIDTLRYCINEHETTLTSKMVSLSILFANPTDNPGYFDEVCEVFTKENREANEKIINFEQIAMAYNTTTDNVKSNILFNEYKKALAEKLTTKKSR